MLKPEVVLWPKHKNDKNKITKVIFEKNFEA